MLHYASGAPTNDDFQVVENQLCRQRLFSVHPNHNKPLGRWLDDLQAGVHSFQDQLQRTSSLSGKLKRADVRMRAGLLERGHDVSGWEPYEDAMLALSDRLGPGYPKTIMLDSGAFTDWNKGRTSVVEDVIRSYQDFLERADGLFDEIILINLDVITETDATAAEQARAFEKSDTNYLKLSTAFPDSHVLPVFHQGESLGRLNDVVEMANGYVCLSPNNNEPQNKREDWTLFHNTAVSHVRCHGLATTGNRMMRVSGLHSGDSTSWKTHGGQGTIDVRWDKARSAANIDRPPLLPFYQNVHVSIERNSFDGNRRAPNNPAHISELPVNEQSHIKSRAEKYLPFPMVQLDRRAMSIVSLGEIQSVAEDQ